MKKDIEVGDYVRHWTGTIGFVTQINRHAAHFRDILTGKTWVVSALNLTHVETPDDPQA